MRDACCERRRAHRRMERVCVINFNGRETPSERQILRRIALRHEIGTGRWIKRIINSLVALSRARERERERGRFLRFAPLFPSNSHQSRLSLIRDILLVVLVESLVTALSFDQAWNLRFRDSPSVIRASKQRSESLSRSLGKLSRQESKEEM